MGSVSPGRKVGAVPDAYNPADPYGGSLEHLHDQWVVGDGRSIAGLPDGALQHRTCRGTRATSHATRSASCSTVAPDGARGQRPRCAGWTSVGLFVGTREVREASPRTGDEFAGKAWIGTELAFQPEAGQFFALDSDHLLRWPYGHAELAVQIADYETWPDADAPYAMDAYSDALYAVTSDSFNPTANRMWHVNQGGARTRIGQFPLPGNGSFDFCAGMVFVEAHNVAYFFTTDIDPVTAGWVWRVPIADVIEDTGSDTRMVIPSTDSPLFTVTHSMQGAAAVGIEVYFTDGEIIYTFTSSESGLISVNDVTMVGTLPVGARTLRGLSAIDLQRIAGVHSTNHRQWFFYPGDPAGAFQEGGQIPDAVVDIEVEGLAFTRAIDPNPLPYVPPDEAALFFLLDDESPGDGHMRAYNEDGSRKSSRDVNLGDANWIGAASDATRLYALRTDTPTRADAFTHTGARAVPSDLVPVSNVLDATGLAVNEDWFFICRSHEHGGTGAAVREELGLGLRGVVGSGSGGAWHRG